MIGTVTEVNKKKTSVQRKFAEIRTFKIDVVTFTD